MPKQAVTQQPAEGVGRELSGMELHLIHQLQGLERSVQRVEEQVSSNKQTRRLLKAVSTPVQVSWLPIGPIKKTLYWLQDWLLNGGRDADWCSFKAEFGKT